MVEDDALVRRFALAALRRLGYEVIEASTGEEAVRIAAELPRPPHLLFTDVVMPGMNGPETARQVRTRHPGVRVLYASGYTDDIIVHHGVLAPGVAFLEKPYSTTDLGIKIRAVLDGPVTG
jgi:CheY-like chemotaxis protein